MHVHAEKVAWEILSRYPWNLCQTGLFTKAGESPFSLQFKTRQDNRLSEYCYFIVQAPVTKNPPLTGPFHCRSRASQVTISLVCSVVVEARYCGVVVAVR